METILFDLIKSFPQAALIFTLLGAILVSAQIIVTITPSNSDNIYMKNLMKGKFGFVFRFIEKFAPFIKKP